MGAPARDEREKDGETRVLIPLAPLGEGLTELHPFAVSSSHKAMGLSVCAF